jgi:hypothetical protein
MGQVGRMIFPFLQKGKMIEKSMSNQMLALYLEGYQKFDNCVLNS